MIATLKELWSFRSNICAPRKEKTGKWSGSKSINFGTYVKPLARLVGAIVKHSGYHVRYRGRGRRLYKYSNMNNDIRIKDALFLAVYGDMK